MDGQRFDAIAKAVAQGSSRRALLRGAVTALTGALTVSFGANRGEAAPKSRKALGTPCAQNNECSSGRCVDGVCCDSKCTGQCEHCTRAGLCVPTIGTPVGDRTACKGDGSVCGGTCDGVNTKRCTYADATTPCREATCEGATATLPATCDGKGACRPSDTVDCSPYQCGDDGTCLTTCDEPEDCIDGFCTGGGCCPGQDYCGYSDVCCDADRSPTASCCPTGDGCCECFYRSDPGNEGPVCCPPDKVCGVYPNDKCCHDDEKCVAGGCVWEERVCGGGVCPNQCCGDQCCGPWDTCGTDEGGNPICVPLPVCAPDDQGTCGDTGTCASAGFSDESVCCPGNRLIDLTQFGAPAGTHECCPFGTEPTRSGDPTTCAPGPNFGGTSRGTSIRI